ncbi:MAG: hypothetical protein Q8L88_14975 [Bacteroidota bacterium]|nr:hypothetical protein [Bacteroidota bacterium]
MRYSMKLNILCSIIALFFVSGCYTQLMTPQDYMKVRTQQSAVPFADNSYSINYNQSCTSCHSVAELNERSEELEYYGVRTVHDGIALSNRLWVSDNTNPDEIYYAPEPIFWPAPNTPINPWWVPPVSVITTPTQPTKGSRPRTNGPTRDGSTRGEKDKPISSPTTAQPTTPVGGTTTTPVTTAPAPAVTITPAQSSTTPSQPTESGRTRDTSSDGNTTTTTKTRSEGSSRDSSGGARPR